MWKHRSAGVSLQAVRRKPNTVKSRYGLVRGDVVFKQQIVTFEGRGARPLPWYVPVAWPSVAVRGVRMAHEKKQRSKENREPDCVMLGAEHLFS